MGTTNPRGLVFDTGALIAFEQGNRQMRALVAEAKEREASLVIPAGVLAQAWRNGSRQARLAALVSYWNVTVEPLTEALAKAAGELCGRRQTRDVVDATVVLAARYPGRIVVTSDADDLHHLDPTVRIVVV